ncbi:DNA polymerase III subunit gamma/tau [Marinicrinis lubricantis]|uniref:DNA-directed DNA polymerase n=1 Tax=Marinicrinis lubricantis TaxID=2086470 RepID=A0ABW1IWA5_9BACL
MSHIALYRAWRPQRFADVVGQSHIIRTLQNALKDEKFSHAYLFSGPRGTGKTSAAKIMAKAVNCEHGPAAEPCNECEICRRITEGAVMDVQEIDAASNRGVEEIREIRDRVKYAPTEVRTKVYIIDEVHMLTTEAFNALLKTLEEPPPHVMFILATTEPHRIPATIISRCQRFDFRRVTLQEQVDRISHICAEENIQADARAVEYIARLSDGGMRDALSLLDQISSYTEGQISYEDVILATGGLAADQFKELASCIVSQRTADALSLIDRWMQEGKSAEQTMEHLIGYYQDLLLVQLVPEATRMTERIIDMSSFTDLAGQYGKDKIFEMIDILNRYHAEMKYAPNSKVLLEVAVMKLSTLSAHAGQVTAEAAAPSVQSADVQKLLSRIEELEKHIKQLDVQQPGAGRGGSASSPSRPSAPSRSVVSRKLNLGPFLENKGRIKELLPKWGQILGQVKERRITVHAWLMDGEPVSMTDQHILVAFKNNIHRETTEKPQNKQIIEQVIQEVTGSPYQLETVMLKEWEQADSAKSDDSQPEMLYLEHEQESEDAIKQEDWIREAIQLFGEDLVTIKEDDKGDE